MKDFIIVAGAPGSGKTVISELIKEKLKSPLIDFGWLREFHLKKDWSNQSKDEEQMAFENLIFILKNYQKHGFKNVIVNDLQDVRIQQISKSLSSYDYTIITLIIDDEEELKGRIQSPRDSGYNNVDKAIVWNQSLINRELLPNEHRIDNTHQEPEKTVRGILRLIQI